MSKITEPMLLDKTGQQFLGLMEKQNELLTAIASGYNYKPTSIADVFAVVQSGNASQVFNYGDQIILPWTDKAIGKTYECPLDVVHFGDVTLADGETVPGMLVQWHYATPFGVQFNQFQAFKYCEEQLPAGTYNVIIGDTWGNNCVKGKTYQFTLTKPVPAKGQLAGLYRAQLTDITVGHRVLCVSGLIRERQTVSGGHHSTILTVHRTSSKKSMDFLPDSMRNLQRD